VLDYLKGDVEYGAMCCGMYGDPKALIPLQQALDEYEVEETDDPFAHQPVIELCGAIKELGGQLTPSQAEKHKRVMAHRERYSDQIDAALNSLSSGGIKKPSRKKPGRNDPCWCGSGKKYKKCHLEADRAASN
jgi:hypothetical protein